MAEVRRYAFDTEFSSDGAVLREPSRRLNPAEVEAERSAAYQRGKEDAIAQAQSRMAAALEAIADAASATVTRLDTESRAMREEAARLAMTAARKIAGASLEAFGPERAANAIEAAMDMLRHQPRLVVHLHPDAAEVLEPRIAEMQASHAYAGAILVRTDPQLKSGAVGIDWSDGLITLDPNDAARRVEAVIESALAAHPTGSQ